ncbi:MAG: response regulator [Deltaproteobacteria bacterium]|jgi:DNA-binding response OmpR family regulator|nr:response regulator [Deltaproteobacteria bacterium]
MQKKVIEPRKRILLIGENPDIAFFTGLQQEGYEVIACESPQKAWSLVFPYRPDFIIVHLHHPSRRDIAILQECRALAEGVPIIVATSVPGNEALMKALEEGATAFLSLPVKPQTIRKVLDELEPSTGGISTR